MDTSETFAASLDAFDRWAALNKALSLDIQNLTHLLEGQPSCQTLRRAYVRGAWGFKEGAIHGLTLWIGAIDAMMQFSDVESDKDKGKTLERLKSVLKACSEYQASPPFVPDFSGVGWQAVVASNKIRDRLMHPKSADAFELSDAETATVQEGLAWFTSSLTEIMRRALASSPL